MMNYKPNFQNKSTRKRCLQVIAWVEKHIGSEPKTLHSSILRKPEAFGSGQLGLYLQKCLLINTNPSYEPGVISKQYRVNVDYLNKLRTKYGLPESKLQSPFIEKLHNKVESEEFEYNDNGLRWYNTAQYIPRSLKSQFWHEHNYDYDYDIDCCAPTLLLQRARKLKPSMKALSYIEFYLNNKQMVRDELAIKHNLSTAQVKQILNALFQGGILNCYSGNKILGYVNNNHYKMKKICNDEFLTELVKDIKSMWRVLRTDMSLGYEYRGDQRRSKRITGRDKSQYYQKIEREVMSVVWKFLKKNNVVHFREHDGFRAKSFVVAEDLERTVLFETGYVVKFKWDRVESSDE